MVRRLPLVSATAVATQDYAEIAHTQFPSLPSFRVRNDIIWIYKLMSLAPCWYCQPSGARLHRGSRKGIWARKSGRMSTKCLNLASLRGIRSPITTVRGDVQNGSLITVPDLAESRRYVSHYTALVTLAADKAISSFRVGLSLSVRLAVPELPPTP